MATTFLMEMHDHPATFRGDQFHRLAQLIGAVAVERAEHLGRQA